MSRIGRKPIDLPKGVEVRIGEGKVGVKGPLGELQRNIPPHVSVENKDGKITVSILEGAPSRQGGAMQGLTRALLNNMVIGVSKGYEKSLDLIGVGYRVKGEGNKLSLSLGFTEPEIYALPTGIEYKIKDAAGQKENQVVLRGIDKAVIGQVAADLRSLRKPEPYKGKGVRYTGERIREKAGKAGAR